MPAQAGPGGDRLPAGQHNRAPPPPPFGVEKAAAGQTAARPLSSGFGGKGREWNPRPQRRGPPDPAIHDYSGGGEGSSTGRRWVFLRGGGGMRRVAGSSPPPEARRCGPGRAGKWRRAATPGGEGARAACGAVAGRARVPPPAAGGP